MQVVLCATYSVPCYHEIRDIKARGDVLQLRHFHRFWVWRTPPLDVAGASIPSISPLEHLLEEIRRAHEHSDQPHRRFLEKGLQDLLDAPINTLKAPLQAKSKGRLKKTTRRDSSRFEYHEEPPKKKSKCCVCGECGHNRLKCPRVVRFYDAIDMFYFRRGSIFRMY